MNRLRFFFSTILLLPCFILINVNFSWAEEEKAEERILVFREAMECRKTTAAVEAYLIDDIMEAKITARMYGTKPKIYNAILVGPRLGRLSIESKEVLLASVEDEEPYPTTKRGGFISFGKRKKDKKAEGALTRELLRFKIPREKIVKDRRYQFWVQVESMQRGGKYETFKFNIDNLAELLSQ